jgi:hypothetical protein
MLSEIDAKVVKAKEALKQFGYDRIDASAREFYDWMTGEIFSDDPTTLRDVLGNEYLMVHELVEMSELKKMGRTIDKRVIVNSPKTAIYNAHLTAMDTELKYALHKRHVLGESQTETAQGKRPRGRSKPSRRTATEGRGNIRKISKTRQTSVRTTLTCENSR